MVNSDDEEVVELEEGDQLELPPRQPVVTKIDQKYESEYRSMEELGKGKFGIVKKCVRKSDGIHLAAKFIKKTAASKKEVTREIEMMNLLHHKRLIALHDAFETKNEMIVIMELVTGGELFEKVVEEDNLTEKQVIRYTKQVLYGVQHMHRKHMVHLDLKPENILCLGGEKPGYEEIKLIDFGMTRVIIEGEEESAICGTPEFVAPEVINYDPVTIAADMWSIGVIVYVLLSGLSPFMGDDDNETLANVSSGEYDFEDADDDEVGVFSNLSDDVKQFISELLVIDPKKRLTVDQSLNHNWLQSEGREQKLDVGNLKKFIARRRWQKTTNTIKAVSRLAGGLNLFSGGKERTHGHSPGAFLDQVKKQHQKEINDEKQKEKEEEEKKKKEEEKKKKEEEKLKSQEAEKKLEEEKAKKLKAEEEEKKKKLKAEEEEKKKKLKAEEEEKKKRLKAEEDEKKKKLKAEEEEKKKKLKAEEEEKKKKLKAEEEEKKKKLKAEEDEKKKKLKAEEEKKRHDDEQAKKLADDAAKLNKENDASKKDNKIEPNNNETAASSGEGTKDKAKDKEKPRKVFGLGKKSGGNVKKLW